MKSWVGLLANIGEQAAAQLFEEKAKKPITQQQIGVLI
jgi:hypothetical protein